MARGRHVKRSGLLARLWPRRRQVVAAPVDDGRLAALEGEVSRLRVLGIAHAAAAASADVRARRAEEHLSAVREELSLTRGQLVALREELLWAFAEGRLPVEAPQAVVVDLRDATPRTG